MPIAVANRYAGALADVAGRTGNYRQVLQELESFASVRRENPELRGVLETPSVPLDLKTKVLEAILARLEASVMSSNFLRVLLVHYRMNLLEEVVRAFRKVSNARLGIAEIRVSSATELSRDQQEALRARFSEITQRAVEMEFHLDPKLLGGIQAQIDSTVYDGTILGQLEAIRDRLLAG